MLESQLARADDFSDDAGSRQAAVMLKQMLTMLVQSPNPAMLTMAQSMMPDLGKIWANDSTRAYLHDLLSTPATSEGGGGSSAGSGSAAASTSAGSASASGS